VGVLEVQQVEKVNKELEGYTFEPLYVSARTLPVGLKFPGVPLLGEDETNTPGSRGINVYVAVKGSLDLIRWETLGMDNVSCHQHRSVIMELGVKRQVKESSLKVEMKVEREASRERPNG
jgi:hypothetical protein